VFQDPRTREAWRTRAIGGLKYEAITRAGDSRAARFLQWRIYPKIRDIGTVQKYENPKREHDVLSRENETARVGG